MSGWVPFDAAWWPAVVIGLQAQGAEWPRELILFDLRWWDDQQRVNARIRRPSSRVLADRWCCSHWTARQLLQAEDEWADPSRSHNGRSPDARGAHAGHTQQDGQTPNDDDKPHTGRTMDAQGTHKNRPTRVGSTDTDTDTDTDRTEDNAGPSPALDLVGSTARAAEEAEAIQATFDAWKLHHPHTRRTAPDEGDRKLLIARLRSTRADHGGNAAGARADLIAVVQWAHLAPSADYLRGAYAKGDGEKATAHLGIATLFKAKAWSTRLDAAREWLADGRKTDERIGKVDHKPEAERAWAKLNELIQTCSENPYADDPIPARVAFTRGVLACGGWRAIRTMTQFEERANRAAFVAAFVEARTEQATPAATTRGQHGTG